MIELKPCPFCGAPGEMWSGTFEVAWDTQDDEAFNWCVYCSNNECFVEATMYHKTKEAAADEWNTRYAGVTNLPITVHDIRHCPLCKNDSFWVREHFNDDEELLRCAGCGNDYLWRRPTKEGQ